jgi:hypothetical protein
VLFFDAGGVGALWDTNSDGHPDTGVIDPGETFVVTVRLKKPYTADVGMGTSATSTVTSVNDPGEQQDVRMNTFIPAPFAQTFREGQMVYTELISEYNSYLALEHYEFRGSSFMLNRLPGATYLGLWEHNELASSVTNLYFTMVSSTGLSLYVDPQQLTDNQEPDMDVRDYNPTAAPAPNGNIGVTWVRARMGMDANDPNTFLKINRNVYFAILNPDGSSQILPPTNVTNETGWYYSWDEDVPKFEGANIAATGDGFFHLTWVAKHVTPVMTISDIAYAVYRASDGLSTRSPGLLTSGNPDDHLDYFEPALTNFQDANSQEKVMLFFFSQDSTDPEAPISEIVYFVRNTFGDPVTAQTEIHQGGGYGIDVAQLSDGNLAIVWTDTDTESDRVAFIVLEQDLTNPPLVAYLYNPDGRPGGNVSVTRDDDGHAILTWIDSKWFQRLYYALVDVNGGLNDPLVFRYSGLGARSGLQTNDGYGNAPYTPWFRYVLPYMPRD